MLGGSAGRDARDQRAARVAQIERARELRCHLLDADAEPAALDVAVLAQLVENALRESDRDRESDAFAAAGPARDRGVDPDHVPLAVDQRAAGVAGIDRRV